MSSKVAVKGIKGKSQVAHAVYDFAKDGGAIGVINIFDLPANTIVHDCWFEVEEALTSGGSATLELGENGGDTDGFIAQAAVAGFTVDKVSAQSEKGALLYDATAKDSLRYKNTAAKTIGFKIATAALLTGKLHIYIEYSDGY